MWDVHTDRNDWVSIPRPIARELIWCPGGPIPDDFWVMWEGPPYRPHSLGNGSKCRRGKGLKTVCLARRCTSVGAVVTSYRQNLCIVLMLSFICKVDDSLLGLTLPLEEIYPSVS